MNITLVKKIMEDGQECRKCREVSDLLEKSNELRFIDTILYADMKDPGSEGSRVAMKHNVEIAPFFVVEKDGEVNIYKSYMQFKRDVLKEMTGGAVQEAPVRFGEGSLDIEKLNKEFETKTPQEALEWAFKEFHPRIAFAWSGAEDVALVDMLAKINADARIFTLDTGRLNPETYELIDRVRERYGIDIEVMFPDSAEIEGMVRSNGMNLFYESIENRKLCCKLRKVQPLKRALSGLDAWVTGLRRDQAMTRTVMPKIEIDETFGSIIKVNPIAGWTNADVWDYIKKNDVPYNSLHDRGYPSIGCASCTRAVADGEDIRSGRWWWESPENRECGLHVKNK